MNKWKLNQKQLLTWIKVANGCRACCLTGRPCSWGTSTSTTRGATAARWWPTPPFSPSSSRRTCKSSVSKQTLYRDTFVTVYIITVYWRKWDTQNKVLLGLGIYFDLILFSSDLPDEKPRITGIKEKYQIGETLEALCTSWQSHPPANLTWFINEEKVKW